MRVQPKPKAKPIAPPSTQGQSHTEPLRRNTTPNATMRGLHDVDLQQLYATQKDINVAGRIVGVDLTVNFSATSGGQWMKACLRGPYDICYPLQVFGVSPKLHEEFKSLNGKCVKLYDVSVAFTKDERAVHSLFSIVYSGPHSKFGKFSGIQETAENPLISKAVPNSWLEGPTLSLPKPSETREDRFEDYMDYPCMDCGDGSTHRCSKRGFEHPKICDVCKLIDCDTIVPYCPAQHGKRHKPDPAKRPTGTMDAADKTRRSCT